MDSENTIKVNTFVLEAQVDTLHDLCSNTKLTEYISEMESILSQSQGMSRERLVFAISHIKKIQESLNLLFSSSWDFLKNANSSFIEADREIGRKFTRINGYHE
jgi:hypothetical protein